MLSLEVSRVTFPQVAGQNYNSLECTVRNPDDKMGFGLKIYTLIMRLISLLFGLLL